MRTPRYLWPIAGAVLAAAVAVPVEYAHTHSALEAVKALLAVALAGAVACLATSLPGVNPRGLLFGGVFVTAGMLSWSYMQRPLVVWGVLLAAGVVFLVWARPWIRYLRPAVRLGTAWLGVAYWILGLIGAVLVLHGKVAAQRFAYMGVFGLAVLAVVATVRPDHRTRAERRADRGQPAETTQPADEAARADQTRPAGGTAGEIDLSVGVAAAFLLAIAALFVSGSGNLFDAHHVVVAGPWGGNMAGRFWGGPWLLYHPNSLAGIAVAVMMRIGPDRRFAVWQRLATTGLAALLVYYTNSRTGFLFFGAAATAHAALLWWRHRRPVAGLAEYGTTRRTWVAAAAPFLALALVLVVSGGRGFLFQSRYGGGDLTSGRLDTWKQVATDWVHANPAEQLFGDARTSRAVVQRTNNDGQQVDLTTDNAAVGSLRRGGVLGVATFLIGLALLLAHAIRRDAPAWYIIAALASVPTIATTDWLLGGTGGTLWILLVAGEATLVLAARRRTGPEPAAR